MFRLTKKINVVIPCSPYLPHGALVAFFTLSGIVERWNLLSVSLLPSLFLKSIEESMIAMILWFLDIRHSDTLLGMWFLTSAQQMFLLILPSKAKYVKLMGKGKGYNSSHVYCQAKGWSKKS
jgi:hypothetical protein